MLIEKKALLVGGRLRYVLLHSRLFAMVTALAMHAEPVSTKIPYLMAARARTAKS